MIFDTHCHYNLYQLVPEWQSHWQTAQAAGVQKSLTVGTTIESSQLALSQAQTHKHLFCSLALHPYVFGRDEGWSDGERTIQSAHDVFSELLSEQKAYEKIIAIGETGLDYYRLSRKPEDRDLTTTIQQLQKQSLQAHIALANTYELPLILHVRDTTTPETPADGNAYWDTLDIVTEQYHWKRPCILHCVSGPMTYVQNMIDAGAYIGVAGNYTYRSAQDLKTIVARTPSDRIIVETDAPFLAPVPHRGAACLPHMITETVASLKNTRDISAETLWNNSNTLFFSQSTR